MSRHSGVVLVELREGRPTGEAWQAHLYLTEGQVVTCRIYSKRDGRLLFVNEEAMRWLTKWGQREFAWLALTPKQTRSLHPPRQTATPQGLLPPPKRAAPAQRLDEVPPMSNDDPPQRLILIEQDVMRSLPRNHRRVLALVDGKRSVEKIAAMLRLPLTNVEVILSDLHRAGAIRRG